MQRYCFAQGTNICSAGTVSRVALYDKSDSARVAQCENSFAERLWRFWEGKFFSPLQDNNDHDGLIIMQKHI